jgi:hypothetical protein
MNQLPVGKLKRFTRHLATPAPLTPWPSLAVKPSLPRASEWRRLGSPLNASRAPHRPRPPAKSLVPLGPASPQTRWRGESRAPNPTARACITCHNGPDAQAHAAVNTYTPPAGQPIESCTVCHQTGAAYAVDVVHNITTAYSVDLAYPREPSQ